MPKSDKAICLLNKSDEKKSVLVDFALLAQIRTFGRRFGGTPPAGIPGTGTPGFPGAPGAMTGTPPNTATTPPPATGGPGGFGMQGPGGPGARTPLTLENFRVRDVWDQKDLTLKESSLYVDMVPHSVKVYRFVRK